MTSQVFTFVKQLSMSNYSNKKEFYHRLESVIQDHFENHPTFHFELKEIFIEHQTDEIVILDIPKLWEKTIELNFEFHDFQTPQEMIDEVKFTIHNLEGLEGQNIVVRLNTYLTTGMFVYS